MVGVHDAQAGRRGPFGKVGVVSRGRPHRVAHDLAGQDRSADLHVNDRRHRGGIATDAAVRVRAADLGVDIRLSSGGSGNKEHQPRQHKPRVAQTTSRKSCHRHSLLHREVT